MNENIFNANKMHLAYSTFTVDQIKVQTTGVLCGFHTMWDAVSLSKGHKDEG